jgi:type VI secretion system protein ImpK
MDSDNDPFGLRDSDRTEFVRPRPGGRVRDRDVSLESGWREPPVQNRAGTGSALPSGTPGMGPLVEAGFGLLALAPLLRSSRPPADPATLKAQIERELARFVDALRGKKCDDRTISLGHYCLCALLDDAVLNTPWGAEGPWRSSSLTGTIHHDVAAGERFFDYLEGAMRVPDRSRPVLEMMAACLALGFEGRYRLTRGGGAILQQLRSDLAAILTRLSGETTPDLSGHWQGVPAAHRPVAQRIPLWAYATAFAAVLLLIYAGLAVRLGDAGDAVDRAAAALPPSGPVVIARSENYTPAALPIAHPLAPALRACLSSSGQAAADAVVEDVDKVRVRLPNAGMFASGKADLNAHTATVVRCLATVLHAAPGKVMVLGYTDNQPIHTTLFPNNWALSKARAEAVAGVFREAMPDGDRVVAEGRSDTDPIASNADASGRARNRRVDIVVLR